MKTQMKGVTVSSLKENKEVFLNQHLSEHFRLIEFVRSGTAIRLNIVNTPSPQVVERLRALCVNVLEPLRRRFGVLRITSGRATCTGCTSPSRATAV